MRKRMSHKNTCLYAHKIFPIDLVSNFFLSPNHSFVLSCVCVFLLHFSIFLVNEKVILTFFFLFVEFWYCWCYYLMLEYFHSSLYFLQLVWFASVLAWIRKKWFKKMKAHMRRMTMKLISHANVFLFTHLHSFCLSLIASVFLTTLSNTEEICDATKKTKPHSIAHYGCVLAGSLVFHIFVLSFT